MIRLQPIRVPALMNALATLPDCAIATVPPRRSDAGRSSMYVALGTVRSTMPMQFGPEERDARLARDLGDLGLHPRRRLAALDDAAARDDRPPGTPAAAASRTTAGARSGLSATTTMSGTSGSDGEVRVATGCRRSRRSAG